MTTLLNLRIPTTVKNEFHHLCRNKSTYMTTEIMRFIHRYIHEERNNTFRPTQLRPNEVPKGKSRKVEDDGWFVSPQVDDHQSGWLDRDDYL